MARYLVTGGAGFIGSNTARWLLRKKHQLRLFDNFFSGKRENLQGLLGKVQFIRGDVRNLKAVSRAMRGVDCVIHLAAVTSVERSVQHPELTHDVNVNGTFNVLEAARKTGVRRVVLASSSSVYGDATELPKKETAPMAPLSPYAATKAFNEIMAQIFWKLYGLETVSLRYFNVFGPHQDPDSHYAAVIPIFMKAMLRGKKLPVCGDGRQTRDFTFVENVCAANELASRASQKACGESFNIACGERVSVLELARKLGQIFRRKPQVAHLPPRQGEVRHSQADIRKARALLGYVPQIDFFEGLQKTVEWARS